MGLRGTKKYIYIYKKEVDIEYTIYIECYLLVYPIGTHIFPIGYSLLAIGYWTFPNPYICIYIYIYIFYVYIYLCVADDAWSHRHSAAKGQL